jgi:isoleucyl-tRNA synthetase
MPKVKDFRKPADFPALEKEILNFWDENKTFEASIENRQDAESFSFYDGPPFATGLPHYGHLLQSIIKDLVPRYQTMKGKKVRRVWGWDCHGLPIENIIEKELGLDTKKEIEDYGVAKFNEACRSTVLTYAEEWKKTIHRIGRWIDMDNAYKTMDKDFMESVWWVFKQLWDKGLIYKSHKSMHICPRCVTPLSNFEVTQGYKDVKDISVTAKFEIDGSQFVENGQKTYILAWTTTPWTLPGNVLLAVNEEIDYLLVTSEGANYLLAKDRVEDVFLDKDFELIKELKGSDLVGLEYQPVFPYFKDWKNAFRVVAAAFVSTEEGTGIVHIAPAFGEDDYQVGLAEEIDLLQHVSMDGHFIDQVKDFAGMEVKPRENPQATDIEIIKYLAHNDKLFSKKKIEHSYPHCWRCDTPLLNYATNSWFVEVTKFKEDLLKNNQQVNWQPEHIKDGRFGKWLEGARDWAISRNRFWGTPLPVWLSEDGEDMICVGSVEELEELSGQKVEDLHKHIVDEISFEKDGKTYRHTPEVLDCWFESGSMPYGQLHYPFENKELMEAGFPADFISEGQDQTRGWFYTLHVLATALSLKGETSSAYKNVMCTGLIMAEDGKKMSKRLKNYPEPDKILEKYGADSLRLYMMASPAVKAETLNFVEKDVANLRRRVFLIWWNVLAFYKTFADQEVGFFDLDSGHQPSNLMDRWILSRLQSLNIELQEALDSYDVMKASRLLAPFVDDFSTWYLRLSRERIKSADNKEVSQVFATVIYTLAQLFAPVVPFFAELIHHNMIDEQSSIHLTDFPEVKEAFLDKDLEAEMAVIRQVVEQGHAKRKEAGIAVRQPLATLKVFGFKLPSDNKAAFSILQKELNVKAVEWKDATDKQVDYDFELTPELKAEGEARALIRKIQKMRREAKLDMNQVVDLGLTDWPAAFKEEIESKTKTRIIKAEADSLL